MDEQELADCEIRDGLVATYGVEEKDWLFEEFDYLELLRQVCLLRGLSERSELLTHFIADPQIANGLLEADAQACNERWKRFVPFLPKKWVAPERRNDRCARPRLKLQRNYL